MRSLITALAVASTVVAFVAGCEFSPSPSRTSSPTSSSLKPPTPSSSKQADRPLPDPAALLKQSSATTKSLKSAHLVLSETGNVAGMPVRKLGGDLTNEPSPAAKGDAMVTIMGVDVGVQFVIVHRWLYVALPGAGWKDYGFASSGYDITATLDPNTGLANLLTNFIDPKVESRETIDDEQTVQVSGTVTAAAANKLIPQLGATKRMATTVWIQERGDHQLVRIALEPDKDDSVQMTLSNWNESVTVDKPKGA